MSILRQYSIIFRVLLPLILIPLLGISSQWRVVGDLFHSAIQAINNDDSLQASRALIEVIQYVPWRDDLWELAGIHSHKSGQDQEARTYLQLAYDSSEISPSGLTALGDELLSAGDHSAAIKYWLQALDGGGDSGELNSRLAAIYRELGDYDRAIHHQSQFVIQAPQDAKANYQLGLMLATSKPESALAYLTLAGELDAEVTQAAETIASKIRSARVREDQVYLLVSAAQGLASIGEWEYAVIALENAVELNPNYADAWAYLGEALHQIGQDGSKELERALVIDPDSIAANTLMGLYWQREDRYDLALVYLHAAALIDDDNPAIQAEIGNTLALLGNLTAAETHYRRAVEFAPRNPVYWHSLANFYIKYEINLRDEGLAAARQAVILNQSDPTSLDLLGQIYLLMDSPYIARRFIQRALDVDPEFFPANLHLGLIQILEGDRLQAYQRFSFVYSNAPEDSPVSDQARRLLETHFP